MKEMKNVVYPVMITPSGTDHLVYVPDLDVYTEGKDFADAIRAIYNAFN